MPLFDTFPHPESETLCIRAMAAADVDAMMEITQNDNVYQYIPPFLHNKSRRFLITAIQNLSGRDFEKHKMLIAGIYLRNQMGISTSKAFVMPEKVASQRVLLKNGFVKEPDTVQGKNWGGQENVRLDVFLYSYK